MLLATAVNSLEVRDFSEEECKTVNRVETCKTTIFSEQKYFNGDLIDTNLFECNRRGRDMACSNEYHYRLESDRTGKITIIRGDFNITFQLFDFLGFNLTFEDSTLNNSEILYNIYNDSPSNTSIDMSVRFLPNTIIEEVIIKKPWPFETNNFNITYNRFGLREGVLERPIMCDFEDNCIPLRYFDSDRAILVEINASWLYNPNRSYPIIIDPTIGWNDSDVRQDNTVKFVSPSSYVRTKNPPNLLRLGFRNNQPIQADATWRSSIDWNISNLPNNAILTAMNFTYYTDKLALCGATIVQYQWRKMDYNATFYPDNSTGNFDFFADMGTGGGYANQLPNISTYNTVELSKRAYKNLENHSNNSVGWFSFGMLAPGSEGSGCIQPTSNNGRIGSKRSAKKYNLTMIYVLPTCVPPESGDWRITQNCTITNKEIDQCPNVIEIGHGGSLNLTNVDLNASRFIINRSDSGIRRIKMDIDSQISLRC